MDINIDSMTKYIIEHLGGTDADNEFIENLGYLANINKEKILSDQKIIVEKINRLISFINTKDDMKLGIKTIKDIFGFVIDETKEVNFSVESIIVNGNFYFFVGNIKIKSTGFLCRAYSFIKKYTKHTDEENEKRRSVAIQMTKRDIIKQLNTIDCQKVLHKADEKCKSDSSENQRLKYTLNENKIEKAKDNTTNAVYELTNEYKKHVKNFLSLKDKVHELTEEGIGKLIKAIQNIYDINIQNKIELFEEELSARETIKSESENRSLRYFLFDNCMKEIEFWGIESRFNWLWEQEKNVYLFRNVSKKEPEPAFEEQKGVEYIEHLMRKVVKHASGLKDIHSRPIYKYAISYSRNPIRDFYKYIDIKGDLFFVDFMVNVDSTDKIIVTSEYKSDTSGNTATFEIVKNVETNSLKITNQDNKTENMSFYNYLKQDESSYSKTLFCIEFCKENSIIPYESGRRLIKLQNYLHTWGINDNFMLSRVSDKDDEVIVSTNYFSDKPGNIHQYPLNIEQVLRTLYQMLVIMYGTEEVLSKIQNNVKKWCSNNLKEVFKNDLKSYSDSFLSISINYNENINLSNIELKNKLIHNTRVAILNEIPKTIKDIITSIIIEKDPIVDQVIEAVNEALQPLEDNHPYKNAFSDISNDYIDVNPKLRQLKKLFLIKN